MLVVEVHIELAEEHHDLLVASFQDDFEGFRTEENQIWCYTTSDHWNKDLENDLRGWLKDRPGSRIVADKEIAERNWNEEWEKTIVPISAGGFVVLPSWSTKELGDDQAIIIDPKMSFGTGHHETTRLMLGMLKAENFDDQHILDAGTGTGVLAIAAVKLGSRNVVAFDIDEWSTTNGVENREVNQVQEEFIDFRKGNFEETIEEEIFDGILANINRNALLEMLPQFHRHLRQGGFLLISGLLDTDEVYFCEKANKEGFQLLDKVAENEWIGLRFNKA